MAKKQYIIGALLLVFLTASIYISLPEHVKIELKGANTVFSVWEDGKFVVSGTEYNSIYSGSKKVSPIASEDKIYNITNGNIVQLIRERTYSNGEQIKDTYEFDGSLTDVALFPVNHKIEIFNAKGKFYRYEVKNLVQNNPKGDLKVNPVSFGRNMKLTYQEKDKRWAKLYASSVAIQYGIPSDYEVYSIRLFDPPSSIQGFGNTTDLNTGTVTNQTAVVITKSSQTQVFNKSTISTGVANLSSISTIVTKRKDIGAVFDSDGDAIVASNTKVNQLNQNFTILIKAMPKLDTIFTGTFIGLGNSTAADLTGSDYAIGYQGDALLFYAGNGTNTDGGSYDSLAPTDVIDYIACGINSSDMKWCSLNGVKSATSWPRGVTYRNVGNDTVIGSAQPGSIEDIDMEGNVYRLSIVNKTLSDDELRNAYWNDGEITGSLNVTITRLTTNNNVLLMDNGTLIIFTYGGNSGTNVSISTNNGATQTFVTNLGTVFNDTINAFRDNYNNTFITNKANGGVWKSASNDLATWTNVLNMSCDNATNVGIFTFQNLGFSQAPNGDEYISTYTLSGNNDEMCGHVYRSQDFGNTWSLVFNATSLDSQYPGRHVHFVQADPYTGYVYISVGDGVFRHGFYRSTDNGNTWTKIGTRHDKDISWQPTMIAFTPQYRIIGEDFNPVDGYSKIWRSSDDVNWEEVANQNKEWYGFWGWSLTDPSGRIYTGQQVVKNSSNMVMLMSEDGFNSSSVAYLIPNGTFADLVAGIQGPSNFAKAANKFCFIINGVQNYTCVNYVAKPQVLSDWRLNENTGNKTIESINGYVGNLLDNTNWTNGSASYLLNPNVDYKINTSATYGNVTLLNNKYNNSALDLTLARYTSDSIYNYLNGYWAFDADNSSTGFDYSNKAYSTTYVGSTYKANDTSYCIYGYCGTNFGAASSYVRVNSNDAGNLTSNATVIFWAKLGTGSNQLISKWNVTNNNRMYALSGNPADSQSNTFIMTYSRNGTSSNQSSFQIPYVFRGGSWSQVTIARTNDNRWDFYVNGVWRGNYSDTVFNSGLSDLRFGEREGGGFNGSIDEIMYFNTTLNQEQINNIYRNSSQRFTQYNNVSLATNFSSANRLYVSVPRLVLTNGLSSLLLNVSWTNITGGKGSDTHYIYLPNVNYTFTLGSNTTNVTLNYSLISDTRFITPFFGMNQTLYSFTSTGTTVPTSDLFNVTFIAPFNGSVVYALSFNQNVSSNTPRDALVTSTSVSVVNYSVAPSALGYYSWASNDYYARTVKSYFGNIPSLPMPYRNFTVYFILDQFNLGGKLVTIPVNLTTEINAYAPWAGFNSSSLILTGGSIYGGTIPYNSTQDDIPFYVV